MEKLEEFFDFVSMYSEEIFVIGMCSMLFLLCLTMLIVAVKAVFII